MKRKRSAWISRSALAVGTLAVAFFLAANHANSATKTVSQIGWQSQQLAFSLGLNGSGNAVLSLSNKNSTFSAVPSDTWDPYSPSNTLPLTDIQVVSCAFAPSLFSDACRPRSTAAEDAVLGPWIRVDRDLNRHGLGIWYLFLYYRRLQPNARVPVITDIRILSAEEAKLPDTEYDLASGGWRMLEESLRSGIWKAKPANLWYRTGTENAITELDVVYGESALRPGWEDAGVISEQPGKTPVRLQARRQDAPATPARPELRLSSDGKFKILQIADLHFSDGDGLCRNIVNTTACPAMPERADNSTLEWLRPLVEEVRPDLIILTGDQLNGQETSWAAASVINKVAAFFIPFAVPWTVVFGNHDSEATDLDRTAQMAIYEKLPYFVGSAGPADVDGVGNYRLPLKSADPSNTTLFNLYFLDSHANYKPFFSKAQYDWIKESQINWYRSESGGVQPILRPYSPADLSYEEGPMHIGPSKRQQTETYALPNAMAVWHIPVPEAYDSPDRSSVNGELLEIGSTSLEGVSSPQRNSGFFASGLLAQSNQDGTPEVKVTIHGHSHLRDACSRIRGVWMCFSGGSSYAGYGLVGFDRRVRVYEIADYGERISTYKLLDGSGAGARASGMFASASAAQAQATGRVDETDNSIAEVSAEPEVISEEQYHDEVDELVDELKSEEAAIAQTDPEGAAALGELADEIKEEEAEEIAEEQAIEELFGPAKRQLASDARPTSRYTISDYMVLVGQGAME